MAKIHFLPLIFSSLLLVLSISSYTYSQQQCANSVRAGYWLPSSNRYFPVSNINTTLYTHIYYYSLTIDADTFLVTVPSEQVSLVTSFSAILRSKDPSIKTLLSVGTDERQANASNSAFSFMAANPRLRSAFINSTIQLAKDYAFDGVDLAWLYPTSSSDMANLGSLFVELRSRIREETSNSPSSLLLTATTYFSDHVFEGEKDNLDYPIDAISDNLDWANALCFGYHKNSEVTAADAALYDKSSHFSTNYGVSSWLDAGLPSCKLVMGIPLYGRSWFLKNKEKNGLGAQVVAAGPRQKLSNQTGIMAFFEITKILEANSPEVIHDNGTVSAYFHAGGVWLSFDNSHVLKVKIDFALQNGLLGYFLWPVNFDTSDYIFSKQAMDVWTRDQAFIHPLSAAARQASSPDGLPESDNTGAETRASSSSRWSFQTTILVNFHVNVLVFLCYLAAL